MIKLKEERIEGFEELNDLIKANNKTAIFVDDFYFLEVWVRQKIDLSKKISQQELILTGLIYVLDILK